MSIVPRFLNPFSEGSKAGHSSGLFLCAIHTRLHHSTRQKRSFHTKSSNMVTCHKKGPLFRGKNRNEPDIDSQDMVTSRQRPFLITRGYPSRFSNNYQLKIYFVTQTLLGKVTFEFCLSHFYDSGIDRPKKVFHVNGHACTLDTRLSNRKFKFDF